MARADSSGRAAGRLGKVSRYLKGSQIFLRCSLLVAKGLERSSSRKGAAEVEGAKLFEF